jgi:GNAT superfamily N-acetyltransferase
MSNKKLNEVTIRHDLRPGDIGRVIYLHGHLYGKEYNYTVDFETYVAEGLVEFYRKFDPTRNRVWICEDGEEMVGFILLMDRGDAAQLRYFIIKPEYRGIGLGKKLMNLYLQFLRQCGYSRSYLWTTDELPAASSLYLRSGFRLTEQKKSTAFGKPLFEQKYELIEPS